MSRIINVPARGIGKTTLGRLLEIAKDNKITAFEILQSIADGKKIGNLRISRPKAASFVQTIETLQESSQDETMTMTQVIQTLVADLNYEAYLTTTFKEDGPDRIDNLTQFIEYSQLVSLDKEPGMTENLTRLDLFLQSITLRIDEDVVNRDREFRDGKQRERVTLMTLHGSKGLEFPVVFVIGAKEGVLPHSKSTNFDEERRLLFVGMTRAKCLLYVTTDLQAPAGWGTSIGFQIICFTLI